jgi:putative ABC transport system permease protein
MRPLPFLRLAGRGALAARGRTAVTVLGVSLGIAVSVAIRMANESVLASFRQSLDAVAGRTTLQVSAGEAGLDEQMYRTVKETQGVAKASPIIESTVVLEGGLGASRGSRDVLLVLGIDTLADQGFRDYKVLEESDDPLALIAEPGAVLLTRRFAEAHGLKVGSAFRVLAGGGPRRLMVRGLLELEGAGRALDGRFALMDIAGAQLAFDKVGRLDRIDVITAPGADARAVAAAIGERLGGAVAVEPPGARNRQVEGMLASFQLNLNVLSLIALFVGLFLIYNATAAAVVRRRREIGILRSLGVTRAQVAALVLSEAGVVGLAGGLVGVALAVAMAHFALEAMTTTISSLYAFVRPPAPVLPRWLAAVGVASGAAVALFSAFVPALEAAAVSPREALGRGSFERRRHGFGTMLAAGIACAAAAYAATRPGPVGGQPVFGYVSAFLLLLGTALVAPAAVAGVVAVARPFLLGRGRWAVAALAVVNLRRGLWRNGGTVAAVAVGLAMLVSVATMIGSFRRTVDLWLEQTVRADLLVSLAGRQAKGTDARIPERYAEVLARIPGVAAVDPFRGVRMEKDGHRFILGSGEFAVQGGRSRLLFLEGDSSAILAEAKARNGVVISETFANATGVRRGDRLRLATPVGERDFPVSGVYYDYTTEGGLVVMDRALYRRLWNDPYVSNIGVYLAPGADAAAVRARILNLLRGRPDVIVFTNRSLREHVLRIFDQTFAITYALQAIALVVAVLGILNTVMASVMERQREIGTLRALGFTRLQIFRMVAGEAGAMGALGNLLGAAAGIALSLVLIYVINKQSFGWTIQFFVPGASLAGYGALALAAAVAAGAAPAWRAASARVAAALRYE